MNHDCPSATVWLCYRMRFAAVVLDRAEFLRTTCWVLLALLITGCSGLGRQPPAPLALSDRITVLGLPNGRIWGDAEGHAMVREADAALARERATGSESFGPHGRLPPAYFLAISGGGDDGAFGAGLLCGWADSGTRPSFKLVTGISTGALIAPFAFLGSAYDSGLRTMFTRIDAGEVYSGEGLFGVIFGEALYNTAPLFHLISHYVDKKMMADIAREYKKGRLLLIGTTNLDVQRPVIWNIGAIAASGRPGALELVRKILLASAAVPGLFPPVMIDVQAGGRTFQEMNVDGGAVAQAFLYPPQITQQIDLRGKHYLRERRAYIIRNGRLDPEWASVDRRFLSISGRAISTMIHYSGYNDILRMYNTTQRDGVDFNLAYIGRDFHSFRHHDFDPAYMRSLFDYGYAQGRKGNEWHKAPPIVAVSHQSLPNVAALKPRQASR